MSNAHHSTTVKSGGKPHAVQMIARVRGGFPTLEHVASGHRGGNFLDG